jgi:sorting nexin-29
MQGELIEFNSKLHKIINFRNSQIAKLKEELVQLRGPLPNDSSYELLEDAHGIESETESLSNLNSPLINIWIPSAFLRSEKSGSHHVYQIYIRIKNEEWNIFRRFSHFYNLNSKLKQKYPITTTISFPKKKAIGNKDSKFVEARRQLLQDYLRQLVNTVSKIGRDLSLKPCKETLIRAIPFLG